jgi:hypothetical protein
MLDNQYRYLLALYRQADGSALGEVPVEPDWEPVQEWVEFDHLRRSQYGVEPTTLEPVWSEKAGAPYVHALGIQCNGTSFVLPVDYFRPVAQAAAQQFIKQGTLKGGDLFTFLVTAYPRRKTRGRSEKRAFIVEEAPAELTAKQSPLAAFAERSVSFGEPDVEDIAVFVPQRVLYETSELTRRDGATETGGILIGHVRRDNDLFVEVTAQIPAEHTQAASEKLTFTPATWTAVQAALNLRGGREIMLGWWHSHPSLHWCRDCPPDKRRVCALQQSSFFSADDVTLHRQVFPKAYSVALVATHHEDGIRYAMYGWRRALVAQRGFHILTQEGERQHVAP